MPLNDKYFKNPFLLKLFFLYILEWYDFHAMNDFDYEKKN